ncbi:uncharacterized protein zgc:101569 isoform X5 [Acipenser ruthenus]|uniref:uncharacterized protein zgc:101569 isoform X5 n=1 Tax=Acipenser ruthenus TaxID=7906 RepID=UPI00274282D2|nr:uncharacterized protein zgc:101569 isoform X5 [Acipenser ruthenus]
MLLLSRIPCTKTLESIGRHPGLFKCVFGRKSCESSVSAFSTSTQKREAAKQNVVAETHGSIMAIGINRPEARNAVNQETAQQLLETFTSFEKDPSLTAAVFHGIGGNFCSGYDLKELAHQRTSIKLEQDVTKGPGPMGPSRMQFSKPVIAAVSGYAVAGGLELSLLADLRVMEQSAIIGVFCRRFGTRPEIERRLCWILTVWRLEKIYNEEESASFLSLSKNQVRSNQCESKNIWYTCRPFGKKKSVT